MVGHQIGTPAAVAGTGEINDHGKGLLMKNDCFMPLSYQCFMERARAALEVYW
jgi:hypothetical protein